jgi:G3E family GTPase
MTAPLPVTLIGGYLGAGKTTLVNHLLRHAEGCRIVVLVNNFGRLPVDADLIRAADGDVLELTGGCICCSIGGDEGTAYDAVLARAARLDHVLVETCGVALPGAVAQTLGLYAGFRLDGVVVLADAETVERRARDPYVGDAVLAQLAAADLLVLNRTDLAGSAGTARAAAFLAQAAPAARVIPAERAALPPALLLGLREGVPAPRGSRFVASHAGAHAAFTVALAHPVAPQRLAAALATVPGLLRAKGHLRDAAGQRWSLQLVGRRQEIVLAAPGAAAPEGLVCIGLAGQLEEAALAGAVSAAAG